MISVCKTNRPFDNTTRNACIDDQDLKLSLQFFPLLFKTTNNVVVIITDRVTQIYLNSILNLANYKLPFFPIVLL